MTLVAKDGFDEFWEHYPRKESKKDARKAWDGLPASDCTKAIEVIQFWAAEWARQGREAHHIKLAGTWIRGECMHDELPMRQKPRSVINELTGRGNDGDRGRIFDAGGDVRQSFESDVEGLRPDDGKIRLVK